MPECPECKDEFESLLRVTCEYVTDIVRLENGNLEPLDDPEALYSELAHYECPSCGEILFYKTSDAMKFLKD